MTRHRRRLEPVPDPPEQDGNVVQLPLPAELLRPWLDAERRARRRHPTGLLGRWRT